MAENLRTIVLNNGTTPITNYPTNENWVGQTDPARCWYMNDEATYGLLYGSMYNWYAVNTGTLCPTGWHVPTDAEFQTMEVYLGMLPGVAPGGVPPLHSDDWGQRGTDQDAQMKSTTGWTFTVVPPVTNGTNSSGFNGRAGGYRFAGTGDYANATYLTYWWTATEDVVGTPTEIGTAWYREIVGNISGVYRATTLKTAGKYVRCMHN